ncbi:MAG TPA: altronate dehydratase family protein [Trebonia sp.]|jgi:altronate hydrolase|nr:altronate dehydratase family protein [Trebonia sp.]
MTPRQKVLTLAPGDDVGIILDEGGPVPRGHKIALRDIANGAPVHKYGQVIGAASAPITAGDHVHTQNLRFAPELQGDSTTDIHAGSSAPPADGPVPTFDGFVRDDGRVGTRNYIGIVTSVNCSATVAKLIAREAERRLGDFPNVDGVVALTHGTGCGMALEGEGPDMLRRTLHGYAEHPNFAGVLGLGLGCEVNQLADLKLTAGPNPAATLTIQEAGGTAAAVRAGLDELAKMLPAANAARRVPVPVSRLVLGLNCGGSDGYSGITANPALGFAVDMLVGYGGTAVLAETPEIYGAEHLLIARAAAPAVGDAIRERIAWWEQYAAANGGTLDANPSPGNKAGGITTIAEKSLGAVAKGGTTPLRAVYKYAEPVTETGFVFMDTPGYDPVSVTGIVAGGAQLMCFTTGRGSVFGCKPAPSIKLCTNSQTYRHMSDDMDVNCGEIADGTATVAEMGKRIFDLVLATASGQGTASELLGFGEEEFTPWQLGAVF